MQRLVAFGECMVEMAPLATEHQFCMGFAGDTLNTAWYLRRLLAPNDRIDYFTAVGTDAVSENMVKFLKQAGIGTEHILRQADKSVGLYMIQLQGGERSFSYWRSDSAARNLAANPLAVRAALEGANLAYFSGITLAILPPEDRIGFLTELRRYRDSGGCVVFDPNLRQTLWASPQEMNEVIMKAAAVSDIALPSYDDEAQWFGDDNSAVTLDRYMRAQVSCCVVKNGANRLLAGEGRQRFYYDPDPNVIVVDSTAAGDSFNAGFIAARLQGAGLRNAVQVGASLAAQVVAKRGALVETALPRQLAT